MENMLFFQLRWRVGHGGLYEDYQNLWEPLWSCSTRRVAIVSCLMVTPGDCRYREGLGLHSSHLGREGYTTWFSEDLNAGVNSRTCFTLIKYESAAINQQFYRNKSLREGVCWLVKVAVSRGLAAYRNSYATRKLLPSRSSASTCP